MLSSASLLKIAFFFFFSENLRRGIFSIVFVRTYMNDLQESELLACSICSGTLLPNPLYPETVSKYCPRDGDFFVQRFRDQEPMVIFRPFETESITPTPEPIPAVSPPPVLTIRKPTPDEQVRLHRWAHVQMAPRAGHPGFIVKCNETRRIFSSAKKAAEVMGLSKAALSRHLNGKQDDVSGYTFTKLGHNIGYI